MSHPLSLPLQNFAEPKASDPRQPWVPFWYFYKLIELTIEVV